MEDVKKILNDKIQEYSERIKKLEYDIDLCVKMEFKNQRQQYAELHKELLNTYHLLLDFKRILNGK
jgi:hypothetical protein